MARINLLPWREENRKRRRRQLASTTALALVATLLVGVGLHLHIAGLISTQQQRNQYLNTEIAKLDRRIKKIKELEETKANLLARMTVIEELQQSRPEVVHLVEELVATIPEGVFLTRVGQDGRKVVVEGQAQSNARVSSFMRNIQASEWIGDPRLLLIENKDKTGTGLSHFQLSFQQLRAPDGDPEDSG